LIFVVFGDSLFLARLVDRLRTAVGVSYLLLRRLMPSLLHPGISVVVLPVFAPIGWGFRDSVPVLSLDDILKGPD
jgi:hypothetical protein